METWRKHILFYSMIGMLVSLFVSRTALGVFIVTFVLASFVHHDVKGQLIRFLSSPLLWGMSLLFFLPLISGLWSDDRNAWLNILRVKLPLFLLPLAFASAINFPMNQWRWIAIIFIGLVTAGTIWSMTQYVMDTAAVNEGYLRARTLVTPLQDDHVRFSWLVAVTVLLAGWLWGLNKYGLRQSWPLPLIIAWLVIYLHILSARTGLLSFYFMLLAVIFWLVAGKAKPIRAWGLLLLVVALPFAAYLALPTFRNKVKYIKYDFEYFKDAHYLPGGNDATRVISLKAGWELMNGSKLKGVGFGDINKETQDWYAVHYPQMIPSDKILPSSEWLIYGAGCGLVGFLVFTCIVFLPFFLRSKNRKRWWLLNGMVALSFLFDIGLEVQFGIFVYCFVVLMGWKWFSMEPGKT